MIVDPGSQADEIAELVNRNHWRIHAIVKDTVAAGATLAAGGTFDGTFYRPTVLTGVKPGMRAFDEEVFGPVASITSFSTEDQAVELANRSEYGLSAGVFSADVGRAIAVGNRLNEYIRYCTPVIIEANVGKLLAQTTADANGQLSARTQPATGPTLPSIVRRTFSSADLRSRVAALTPAQALIVERTMSGRLAERPAGLQQNLRAMVGPSGIRTGAQAKAFLQAWIVLEDPTPAFEQEWGRAGAGADACAQDHANARSRTATPIATGEADSGPLPAGCTGNGAGDVSEAGGSIGRPAAAHAHAGRVGSKPERG